MTTLDPAEKAASHARWAPPVAGLFVAFCVAWGLCPVPPDHPLYLDDVLVLTAIPVLVTVLACGAVVWFACAALRDGALDARSAALRTAATAVWLPPLVLLAISRSWWAAMVSIVFAVSVSRLLQFYGTASSVFSVRMLWPFLIAICVQLGGAAGLAGYRFEATTFLGMSTGMLTWFAATSQTDAGRERPARRMTVLRLLAMTVLALILTAGGLVQYLALTGGFAQGSIASIILFESSLHRGNAARSAQSPPDPTRDMLGGPGHRGVFLWPETDPHPIWLAPPLPSLPSDLLKSRSSDPLNLPFSGVYWFFKWPDVRPPERSLKVRGTPAKTGLRSADEYPLVMEAHQSLVPAVDLKCCSKIQVVISNADRYPGTVALELLLANATLAGSPAQSLGRRKVTSMPPGGLDDPPPVEEVLTFDVPQDSSIPEFNEMTIRFVLDRRRAETSARISIVRFVFVPR